MAARASLAALISQVRTLIADPGAVQFSDDVVQTALDNHRQEQRFVTLSPSPTFVPSGGATQVLFFDYYSDTEWWEDDLVLQNASYETITADVSENVVGHWHFNVQPTGIAVIATGKTFDVYKSAADLLRAWAGALKLNFAFGSNAQSFKKSEQIANILSVAAEYDRQALGTISRLVQSDAAPEHEGGGVVYPDQSSFVSGGFTNP
jgi:hypothetical protein